jgi:hypothetical protein
MVTGKGLRDGSVTGCLLNPSHPSMAYAATFFASKDPGCDGCGGSFQATKVAENTCAAEYSFYYAAAIREKDAKNPSHLPREHRKALCSKDLSMWRVGGNPVTDPPHNSPLTVRANPDRPIAAHTASSRTLWARARGRLNNDAEA